MKKKKKKLLKWMGIVLLSPVVLLLILAALLYVPPIQNWVARQVAAYASEQTGMEITVDHVDLCFPLDLGVRGLRVVSSTGDTIADVGRAVADVQLWPLMKGEVVLDALELHAVRLNTLDLIGDMRLQGTLGELTLEREKATGRRAGGNEERVFVVLDRMEAHLGHPRLRDTDLTIFMSDTAAVDTSQQGGWRIAFDRFSLERTRLRIVRDSAARFTDSATRIMAYMGEASLGQADLDLASGRFRFGSIDWKDGALAYNKDVELKAVNLTLDSLYAYGDDLRVGIASGSFKEAATGLELTALHGSLDMSGEQVRLTGFSAATPHSQLSAAGSLSLGMDGEWGFDIGGQVGKEDLALLSPSLNTLPEAPLTLRAHLAGTMEQLSAVELRLSLPGVAEAEASGFLAGVGSPEELSAQLDISATLYNPAPLAAVVSLPPGYCVPPGISLTGTVGCHDQRMSADLKVRHGSGTATVRGSYTPAAESYAADISIDRLNLRHFMPRDSLGLLTADVTLSGRGIDPLSTTTQIDADIRLHQLSYGSYTLDSLYATATLRGGLLKAQADARLADLDMLALGIGNRGDRLALSGSIELESDLKQRHKVSALLTDIAISDSAATHHPENIGLLLKAAADTTTLRMQSGDFIVKLDGQGSYQQLLGSLTALADTIGLQLQRRTIDQLLVKGMLPTAKLYVASQQDNPVSDIVRAAMGIDFKDLNVNLDMSPETGLNGTARLDGLRKGSMQIDTLRLTLADRGKGLTFNGQVTNSRTNPMAVFNILFDGQLQEHGARFGVRYFDEQGRRNVRIGAQADMVADGLRFRLIPSRPTLGYKEFVLNDDNFLLLNDDLKLEANIDLKADDGTHLKVYTENQDSTMLQDITISAYQLNLGELTSGIALLPKISGTLVGDFHLLMDQDRNISVASDMRIGQMAYEGSPIGNLGSEFVYLLREDGTHVVDGTLTLADEPIGALQGSYADGKHLDATLALTHMPLSIANGFMPDQLFGFEGFADGTITLRGELSKLMANGEVTFSDGYLVSAPYGMRMRFGTAPLELKDSRLLFNNFTLYAHSTAEGRLASDAPLYINGSANFLDNDASDDIDLRMSARNFQLVNAKQKKESVAYGRMFVNFFTRLSGSLSHLLMRGRLDVLGTTDLNYILLDSPLSIDDRMDNLVRFTDFNDTTQTDVVKRPESSAFDMDVTLSIDQGAHVRCALNAEQTNYVDLLGGGDLRMRMGNDGLNLMGRYTVESGTMKYSLPIIPLKTFNIAQGSYVEFTGQPDNPTLNITATERSRSAVTSDDGQSRSVLFDCGVVITQTLENMGLQFTIAAPEDMQIQNELSAMGTEQRGKLAVTMLTTGMYLADGNTNTFSMNSALSSFLQSEINNITAGALKTVDLQVGLEGSTDGSGQTRTDYSFRFAKRFWNNRLNVQIGGKVSTGTEVEGQEQSFFDNVTMEYRLSPTSNQYVKLFYKQNVYDWLEGYTGEYGGGYIWKRKLDKLTDIFKLKSDDSNRLTLRRAPQPTDSLRPLPDDSTQTKTNGQ